MKNNLYECLICNLENNKQALEFLQAIMKKANLYLFGGAVRDYLDDDFMNFRDLDFVVEFTSSKDLRIHDFIAETNSAYYKTNRFNGYKICFDNLHIDIWELNDTWAFKQNKLEATPENLIKSVFLNMDGLVYSLNENKYLQDCDKIYQKIKRSHYLDIVLADNPFIELNLLRALIMKRRYDMKLSKKLQRSFQYHAENNDLANNFINIQKDHYQRIIIDKRSIESELSVLKYR